VALRPIADGLYEIPGEARFAGQRVPVRSVVARLRDGSLWVHSPVAPSEEVLRAAAAIGPVRHLVAPSRYHHLWVHAWQEAFPEARLYGAPGLDAKRRDLRFDETLGKGPAPSAWGGDFELLVFRGLPVFQEVEILHRPTRTLIVCDLVFHIRDGRGLARLTFRLNDMWRRLGPSRLLRIMLRWNARVAREDLGRLLAWDFDRLVMAHGELVESGGKRALREAYRFLLGEDPAAEV
jgi:hypothetical protein